MPRPDDFTDEFRLELEAEMDALRQAQREGRSTHPLPIPDCLFDLPHFREAWLAGGWLGRKLTAMGLDDGTVSEICFANGQRVFHAPDPWVPTMATLARYQKDGTHDEPGVGLAMKLIAEDPRFNGEG